MAGIPIPFAVGDEVEEKSYNHGFRGAWFRAKIEKIERLRKDVYCTLSYFDYEGETTIPLYQHPPGVPPSGWREIMLRPKFPEIQVIRKWKEGDEADYPWRSARWYGKVVQVIDDHTGVVSLAEKTCLWF
ncbi:uncharacterized protein LOC112345304 [Selaginella moellendorffii]|uniref:uncharacterized protein LOC112345304 n=1 Tax=Selaginella moellendorffii TaxID=88036 RepID=UPI000D1C8091|nr:uncharacterized protein LOC112345304 [Selaginella moellendorffii]|eukprot:XP_024527501.1 uncharacterized protein LOC112345304 [Selaginella moellendorffii]